MLLSSSSSTSSRGGPLGHTAEMAVDAYATRVLQASTPPETFFDTSLGHYVASVLRSTSITETTSTTTKVTLVDVTALAEFEALLELLEDQCNMERDVATAALQSIAAAVVTGIVPPQQLQQQQLQGSSGSTSISHAGNATSITTSNAGFYLPHSTTDPLEQISDVCSPHAKGGPSPLKPDHLIPIDLLGFLDDPSTQQHVTHATSEEQQEVTHTTTEDQREVTTEEAFPPLGAPSSGNGGGGSKSKNISSKKARGKSKNTKSDKELAAALFRPSRTRHNSIENEEASASLSPMPSVTSPTAAAAAAAAGFTNSITSQQHYGHPQHHHLNNNNHYFQQQQLDSCVEILLSMNSDVGEGAAKEAATMANADFNVAQYIVEKALSAPPICRHMLLEGCYRSDCQFSHDVDGHTCLFWLRGRCTKPVKECKFLHGFHTKLMEGIQIASLSAVPTGYPYPGFTLPLSGSQQQHMMPGSWQQQQYQPPPSLVDSSASNSYSSSLGSTSNGGTNLLSFANIASRGGFDKQQQPFVASTTLESSSSATTSSSRSNNININIPTVRIPQDLWNACENRDASVFHIADPLERYRQVEAASGNRRDDVIDLHFQSTKTFGVVLEQVLPARLQQQQSKDGMIWIVTGTGHHVGSKTHQKGGGALERAVIQWLQERGYPFSRGKDRNGLGGALLVKPP